MFEIWKDIPGYEGFYQASNLGHVRSLDRVCVGIRYPRKRLGRSLQGTLNSNGYRYVLLSKNGTKKMYGVHRLVLLSFIGPMSEDYESCHYDGDKTNNRLENLRWGFPKDNGEDRIRHGRLRRGESIPQSKLSEADVLNIRNDKRRQIDIAKDYGITQSNVSEIKLIHTWKHIS